MKENTLFNLNKKQTLINAIIYYIIIFAIYLFLNCLLVSLSMYIYTIFHPEILSFSFNDNVKLGYTIGSYIAFITYPLITLVFSIFFFIKKNLYKNFIAYILVILGLIPLPIIGFIFISFLSLLDADMSK